MRTNIVIDEELIDEVIKLGNFSTKKEAVNRALKEFIELKKKRNLIDLYGKIEFSEDYDYKTERSK